MPNIKPLMLEEIFEKVCRGDFHASNELDNGKYPLISCSTEDNGIEGYFDLPSEKLYKNCITIASDGSPLTAFYHDYEFGAKDNVVICIPNENIRISTIYYILYQINRKKWRFSYGRKCYLNKINRLLFPIPMDNLGNIDEDYIEKNFTVNIQSEMPQKNVISNISKELKLKDFRLGDIFDIESGDYHSISELDGGKIPLISCGERHNGFIGFYDIPIENCYSNTITIAYNGIPLTTKFHPYYFGAKDDVAICVNSKNLEITTIFFISALLNKLTWRFSYGRKCYREKIKLQKISLPIKNTGEIDEKIIADIVKNTPYWNYINGIISTHDLYLRH